MRPVVFDTSVYIPYLRGEAYTALIERAVHARRVRLSAVVLGELYAGTRSPQDKADLDVVTRVYQSLGFLVAPSVHDWVRCLAPYTAHFRAEMDALKAEKRPRIDQRRERSLSCAGPTRSTGIFRAPSPRGCQSAAVARWSVSSSNAYRSSSTEW